MSKKKKTTEEVIEEAVVEAKALRDLALDNAKNALVETFNPKIQSILSAQVSEEEGVEDDEESIVDDPSTEVTDEVPTVSSDTDDVSLDMDAAPGEDADEEEEIPMEGEVGDDVISKDTADPTISEEDDEDLGFDLEPEEEEGVVEVSDMEVDATPEDGEEELDLESLRKFFEQSEEDGVTPEDEKPMEAKEAKQLRKDLATMQETVEKLTKQLKEVNLLNAKLMYTAKVFKENGSLKNEQKKQVIKTFDKAKSVNEVKLVYESVSSAFQKFNEKVTKKTVTEAAGASKPVKVTKFDETAEVRAIREGADRLKELAGLNRNKKFINENK